MKCKCSIITINRNNAAGLQKTLQSVICQSFKDYEHIVIDGASTDNSLGVIKKFSHLSYYVSEPDNGIFYAMNKGLNQAKGEYCLFLNSGDYLFSKDVLEKVFVNNFNQDIVYGNIKHSNGRFSKTPESLSMFYFIVGSLPHQAIFTKTSLLKNKNGYNVEYKIISDYLFYFEAFIDGATYKHLNVIVAFYEYGGVSSNTEAVNKELNVIWQKHFPTLADDFMRMRELKCELNEVYKIPGLKFFMKLIYPFLRRIKQTIKNFLGGKTDDFMF